ncbi:regulation of nuclear pre-mRNA domain-containing protein 1A isoform X2 [Ornithorhynchus anatinus]|uniref:regulation of nuclear pre-mRNA domain-containing protein 1A isoform X2 n=1 Tax=Ornithorhynchus anatinus TaxID=9258 RepID=UPI0010A7EEA6|nr:regulation of nuclear pre-mRNA domain-containing protein 1A isoform X2 [Ornithorhynchus anatinus]
MKIKTNFTRIWTQSPRDYQHWTAKPNRKLTFLYLANDVIQNSKRKGPEFTKDFAPVIVEAFKHVSSETDENCKKHLGRVLSIWEERSVYENDVLEQLRHALYGEKKSRKRVYEQIKVDENENCSALGSPSDPPQTTDLTRALQELENAASSDAAVHQRIASLPVEVQDVSLLNKITDKESGEQLSKMVEDACMLLADYNGRLAAEIDDRKQLIRMLSDFLRCQKEVLAEKEHKLEVRNPLVFSPCSLNSFLRHPSLLRNSLRLVMFSISVPFTFYLPPEPLTGL